MCGFKEAGDKKIWKLLNFSQIDPWCLVTKEPLKSIPLLTLGTDAHEGLGALLDLTPGRRVSRVGLLGQAVGQPLPATTGTVFCPPRTSSPLMTKTRGQPRALYGPILLTLWDAPPTSAVATQILNLVLYFNQTQDRSLTTLVSNWLTS